MKCACDGKGFVTFIGKYKSRYTGVTTLGVKQAKRCPRFVDYFNESDLMRKYPGKTAVPRDTGDACPAAVKAHKELREREYEKEKGERL